jgi:hypothetical protein
MQTTRLQTNIHSKGPNCITVAGHACVKARVLRNRSIDQHGTCNAATRAASPAAPMSEKQFSAKDLTEPMSNLVRVWFICMKNRQEIDKANTEQEINCTTFDRMNIVTLTLFRIIWHQPESKSSTL